MRALQGERGWRVRKGAAEVGFEREFYKVRSERELLVAAVLPVRY